jgi:replication factor C subunit 3/5
LTDFPHLLFFGPSGAGKKTRVNALIRAIYGPSASKVRVETRQFEAGGKTKKKVDITTLSSNFHIEINPSDVGIRDTVVVQEVIKSIAATYSVNAQGKSFKIVVLNEVDNLSRAAQQALRRTMEKYVSTCRIIMLCTSVSRVLGPLKSRCVPIRVPAPTHEQILTTLTTIAKKERVAFPDALLKDITMKSGRNMRKAILMMEGAYVQGIPTEGETMAAPTADWEQFIDEIAATMINEQSPRSLMRVRNKLYELLKNCIPPTIILRTLTTVLMRRLDDQIKRETVLWAAYYEHSMKKGSKPIFHLEAFVAKFMSIYKRWVLTEFMQF